MHTIYLALLLSLAGAAPPATVAHATHDVRIIVIRHTTDAMAVHDTRQLRKAMAAAKSAGLRIGLITDEIEISGELTKADRKRLRSGLLAMVKKHAKPHRTIIIHTIGHGFTGGLEHWGPRKPVFDMLQGLAIATGQRVVWWQLSCHAQAGLPEKSDTRLFTVVSSCPAGANSTPDHQAENMGRVFLALAGKAPARRVRKYWQGGRWAVDGKHYAAGWYMEDAELDANRDGKVTVAELRAFLNSLGEQKWGDLVTHGGEDAAVFGGN